MYYQIKKTLEECSLTECLSQDSQYVVILNSSEWEQWKDSFDLGIDMDLDLKDIYNTKIEVNID